jgi:protein SCO1/2
MRLVAGSLLLVMLAACAPATTVSTPSTGTSGYLGAEITTPYQLPDLTLTASTTGGDFNLRTGSDKPALVVFFGYTNCADICLSTLTDLATAMNRVPDDVRAKLQVLFVTVDPERDTPTALAAYLARIDPGFIGLTGAQADIETVAAALGVAVESGHQHHDNGAYDVSHSSQVIGIDAARQGVVVWTQGTPISTYRVDFEHLVRQQR